MALSPISETARKAGVSADTLRYYERVGLIQPDDRTSSGYRLYDSAAVERLRFIKGAQRMGLRLGEIAELLDIADRGECPCGHTRQVAQLRLGEIDEQLQRLGELRGQLARLLDGLDGCADSSVRWPCATAFTQKGGEE